MTEVYLALGSNIGDSVSHIASAIDLLSKKLSHVKQAPLYRSKAVGYTDQPDFINTAISAETDLSPYDLLDMIKNLEKQLGRIERFRWGPREIDIDIIFYGDQVIESDKLNIPHVKFRERSFVLQPLYDLNPELIDPVTKQTIKALLQQLDVSDQSLLPIDLA
jgi:2-amino-4-hydroxy-6-hydroxymethyldihydropteridine diphosphokinase